MGNGNLKIFRHLPSPHSLPAVDSETFPAARSLAMAAILALPMAHTNKTCRIYKSFTVKKNFLCHNS